MASDQDVVGADLPAGNGIDPAVEPAPFAAGTFALYDMPGGGWLLVTAMAGEDGDVIQRKTIPAALVRLVKGETGGPFGRKMRAMLGGE